MIPWQMVCIFILTGLAWFSYFEVIKFCILALYDYPMAFREFNVTIINLLTWYVVGYRGIKQ